jgi:hypothetical protein
MTTATHIRDTLRHAMVYGGATILGKLVGFIMLPIYAHCLRGAGLCGVFSSKRKLKRKNVSWFRQPFF